LDLAMQLAHAFTCSDKLGLVRTLLVMAYRAPRSQ
jgi:hypothetical protein